MRNVVVYTLMSLDGAVDHPARYFTRNGQPGQPPEFDEAMADNEERVIRSQDAVLLGRHMYDEWSRFWPTVENQPFAEFINNVKKYVVTSTPLTTSWAHSEVLEGPLDDALRDLKSRPGGDIGVHGSIELAQSLLAAGLVDVLHLVVGPAIGFPGRRLFTGTEDTRRLELVSAAPTPSGSVLLEYRVPGVG